MKHGIQGLIACVMVLGIAWFCGLGCETTESSDTVITVTPASPELKGSLAIQTFTASGVASNELALPLIWTVSNPNLGVIRSTAGLSAVYESTGKVGNNIITVRDQGQAEGMATAIQR